MTHLLARLARAVLLWLLGRQPPTRARRALAWSTAVVACAAAIEAGVLGAVLTVVWWLLSQLAALMVGAGVVLALLLAVLAVARRGLRRVMPRPALTELPASGEKSGGSSDIPTRADAPPAAAAQPGSSDTEPPPPTPPLEAGRAATAAPTDDADPGHDPRAADDATTPDPAVAAGAAVEDPLAAEAAWLEAHWAGEPHPNGTAPPAGAPTSA